MFTGPLLDVKTDKFRPSCFARDITEIPFFFLGKNGNRYQMNNHAFPPSSYQMLFRLTQELHCTHVGF